MKRFILFGIMLISIGTTQPKKNNTNNVAQTRISGKPWHAPDALASIEITGKATGVGIDALVEKIAHLLANLATPVSTDTATITSQIRLLYGTDEHAHQPLADILNELHPLGTSAAAIAKRQLNAGHCEEFMRRHSGWFQGIWPAATDLVNYNDLLNDPLLTIDASLRRKLVAFNELQKSYVYQHGATGAVIIGSATSVGDSGPNFKVIFGSLGGTAAGVAVISLLTWLALSKKEGSKKKSP